MTESTSASAAAVLHFRHDLIARLSRIGMPQPENRYCICKFWLPCSLLLLKDVSGPLSPIRSRYRYECVRKSERLMKHLFSITLVS